MVFATIQTPVNASTSNLAFDGIQSHPQQLTDLTGKPIKPACRYFSVATHEEVEETIRKHSLETYSHFVVAKKTKAFGSSGMMLFLLILFRS